MQHRAHAGHTEVQLHVAVAVPRQGANTLARLHTEGRECIGNLLGTATNIGIGAVVNGAFDRTLDDLRLGMGDTRMLDQGGDKQGLVLHQAKHRRITSVYWIYCVWLAVVNTGQG
ncbi:hypothetical protein D3C78_1618830 [compost metagenome]